MNRRAFLKTALAGSVAVAGWHVLAQEKPQAVRLGVIGTGARGTSLLQTLLLLPQAKIGAVCDLIRARADRAASLVEKQTGQRPEVYAGTEQVWEELVKRDDLDAVIIATPIAWHARMAVAAMRAGKYPGVEVPAAATLEECWDLVRTSEQTGVPCMMLENVCYYETVLALLRMVRGGLFGQVLHCEAGYQHDCRAIMFDANGQLTWRGQHAANQNGNLYPTHPLGPVAQWMNINRGDRFTALVSFSTPAKGVQHYAAKRFGPDHPAARRIYAQGDINVTLLKTALGYTVTLYYNTHTHRPYDLILRLEGVRGIYLGTTDNICLEGDGPARHEWEPFAPYRKKFEHPLWAELREPALKSGGHGGAEYLMFHDFLKAVRAKTPAPQDVYDAATWSAVYPLSIQSVAQGGQLVQFPDFTQGRWEKRPPLPIDGA